MFGKERLPQEDLYVKLGLPCWSHSGSLSPEGRGAFVWKHNFAAVKDFVTVIHIFLIIIIHNKYCVYIYLSWAALLSKSFRITSINWCVKCFINCHQNDSENRSKSVKVASSKALDAEICKSGPDMRAQGLGSIHFYMLLVCYYQICLAKMFIVSLNEPISNYLVRGRREQVRKSKASVIDP